MLDRLHQQEEKSGRVCNWNGQRTKDVGIQIRTLPFRHTAPLLLPMVILQQTCRLVAGSDQALNCHDSAVSRMFRKKTSANFRWLRPAAACVSCSARSHGTTRLPWCSQGTSRCERHEAFVHRPEAEQRHCRSSSGAAMVVLTERR